MSKDILGVQISTKRLKIVQVSQGKAVKMFSAEIPDDCVQNGMVVAWEAMEEVLKNAVKDGHFTTKKAAVVIPDAVCNVRKMELPAMTEKQLKVNMPYEFKDVIQGDKEHYTFDYSMIDMEYDEANPEVPKMMHLMGAAISNEILEHYQILFGRSGLKLIKAMPRVIALQQLLWNLSKEDTKHDVAIIDLGYHETNVDIFHNGHYEATRSIDIGVIDAVSAVADKLNCDTHIAASYLEKNYEDVLSCDECVDVYSKISVEIMRSINYYTYENPENNLSVIYYDGYGSWMQPFIQEIANTIELALTPLSSIEENEKDALLTSAAAFGACLD